MFTVSPRLDNCWLSLPQQSFSSRTKCSDVNHPPHINTHHSQSRHICSSHGSSQASHRTHLDQEHTRTFPLLCICLYASIPYRHLSNNPAVHRVLLDKARPSQRRRRSDLRTHLHGHHAQTQEPGTRPRDGGGSPGTAGKVPYTTSADQGPVRLAGANRYWNWRMGGV